METSVLLIFASFVWMALAWFFRQQRSIHIIAMGILVLFDLMFPIYLYMTHDWWHRLIVQQEALHFLVWSHLMLDMVLYALYVLQILAGRAMLSANNPDDYELHRSEHAKQFLGILAVRVLVFASGALLIVPNTPAS